MACCSTELAPHLVRPVPFMLPLTHRGWERPYVGTGVALYDVLSRVSRKGGALPSHRHLSRKATARLGPGLSPEAYTGAIGFFDAQIDDARHTLAVVRTAVAHGALAASRVEVTGFLRDGEKVVGRRGPRSRDRSQARGPGAGRRRGDRGLERRHRGDARRRAGLEEGVAQQGRPRHRAAQCDRAAHRADRAYAHLCLVPAALGPDVACRDDRHALGRATGTNRP